jgi:hypothetical protein
MSDGFGPAWLLTMLDVVALTSTYFGRDTTLSGNGHLHTRFGTGIRERDQREGTNVATNSRGSCLAYREIGDWKAGRMEGDRERED